MLNYKVLLVEDEEILRESIKDDLVDAGYTVYSYENPLEALEFIKSTPCDIIISDIRLPGINGIEFLDKVKTDYPEIFVIMMTAYGSVETAVEAMKRGAYDYITKPFDIDELLIVLNRIIELSLLKKDNKEFQSHFENKYSFDTFIGNSEFVTELKSLMKVVSESDATVLITGETGTGKELIANLIHYNSPRKHKPLIKVSCAVLSKEVLESELFGHEKGAYTGADKLRIGRFEAADGGTIYLDDIDDFPLDSQVKLLRVIQEQEIERMGNSKPVKIDVRIIASTKSDLLSLSNEGKFRNDLYYRLNILPVHLKPLRERKSDIVLLFNHFINVFGKDRMFDIHKDVYETMNSYNWPGNARELKNIVERLIILSPNNLINTKLLPQECFLSTFDVNNIQSNGNSLSDTLEIIETNIIKDALLKTGGNKAKAAEILGIPSSTLKSKIEKYKIT